MSGMVGTMRRMQLLVIVRRYRELVRVCVRAGRQLV